MIPKIIHYCWFGRNPLPRSAQKCIASWKKYCPDYEIIQWNEDNFDISACPLYVRQAYDAKKWAFVTDYVRLKVVYNHGGIYMDTDVELIKKLDKLLKYKAYFGFEDGEYIATGLGFGSEKNNIVLKEMMNYYEDNNFLLDDGLFNLEPCPVINTKALLKYGLKQNDKKQIIGNDILVLPSYYLCPLSYSTGIMKKRISTISIHWFSASWKDSVEESLRWEYLKRRNEKERREKIDYLIHTPNRMLIKLLGTEKYDKLKRNIKRSK